MTKPTTFYAVADAFGDMFYEPRIERLEYVNKYVRGFSEETLKWAEQCAKEYEQEEPKR